MGKSALSTPNEEELPDLVGVERSSCQECSPPLHWPHCNIYNFNAILKHSSLPSGVVGEHKEAKRGTELQDVGQRLISSWGSFWGVNTWSTESYFSCFNVTLK